MAKLKKLKTKPKYWYNQSSVIPFRIGKNGIELLIISTRKKKKWIFPKGIIDPGFTPQLSAKKEAFEEAGIDGEFLPKIVGKYSYKKWGGICKVQVFGMEVNEIFKDFPENFRERKWITADELDLYISQIKILDIVKNLFVILSKDV